MCNFGVVETAILMPSPTPSFDIYLLPIFIGLMIMSFLAVKYKNTLIKSISSLLLEF
ncbi:hypothetical protein MFS40622_1777 [Methanocaldococcus sp. FS406-22]|uniref:hypothetical protein n=1 Tax=Methanocaldococcus sp. (strain FS406-22) TaxID=644281 RepID=UPI0001BF34D8|nr:hypothetical protein [Methanocaldococcus sp. FS406-22]ADC70447.1 hypothetical protein MFS40622_1777 [Methanocaldococcus sp. FS406-22]